MPNDDADRERPARSEAEGDRRKGRDRPALSDSPKQIRSRARRHQKKMEAELSKLYRKPVEDWDLEELAHGKPRSKVGHFSGTPPKWVTRQVHEEAVRRFQAMLNAKVRVLSVPAIEMLLNLMNDDRMVYDSEGQPIRHLVPPAVKSQIGTFLIEHVIGKPNQTVETKGEIAHFIRDTLATALVNPGQDPDEVIDLSEDDADDDEDYEGEGGGE